MKSLTLRNKQHLRRAHDSVQYFRAERLRKLLLNRAEIRKIEGRLIKGTTLVITKLYLNPRGICKLMIAVGKGKKLYDKRESIKTREAERDINRNLKR